MLKRRERRHERLIRFNPKKERSKRLIRTRTPLKVARVSQRNHRKEADHIEYSNSLLDFEMSQVTMTVMKVHFANCAMPGSQPAASLQLCFG